MKKLSLLLQIDSDRSLRTLIHEGHGRALTFITAIFSCYCVVLLAVAWHAWYVGEGGVPTMVALLAFILSNIIVSWISVRSQRPFRVEVIGRGIVGILIVPAAYVLAQDPFQGWWPGFLIMCLGGNIILGLLTGKPHWGRMVVLHYVVLMTLAHLYMGPPYEWYAFIMNAGIVATVGFVFAEIVSLLGRTLAVEREQRMRIENLMINMLPKDIAIKLQQDQCTIADEYPMASILFADIENFTKLSSQLPPVELVELLNGVFSDLDELVERFGAEKIKTIGDCYMSAAGVPRSCDEHAHRIVALALEMQRHISTHAYYGEHLVFRIGINSGPLVAGVIGRNKFTYDLWGDTVNIASRMESHGTPGRVQITDNTYQLVKDRFVCEERGIIPIKGRGDMRVWYVLHEKVRKPDDAVLEEVGS